MSRIYDRIGHTYTVTRQADPRISTRLAALLKLPPGAAIIDIGAGTGNYSFDLAARGFQVTALEPSAVMRAQGRQHDNLQWREGVAEQLPFADGAFDGAVMTLCLHHFSDWRQGLAEALRVIADGPLVIFAFDARRKSEFWLEKYLPELITIDAGWGYTIEDICSWAGSRERRCVTEAFPIPADIKDHFLASGWARPEIYLDQKYRMGISSFSRISAEALTRGLSKLQSDLESGRWQELHGNLKSQVELDVGYLFLALYRD